MYTLRDSKEGMEILKTQEHGAWTSEEIYIYIYIYILWIDLIVYRLSLNDMTVCILLDLEHKT